MNTTNAKCFTFNVDNSLFITGQTGSGKSYLVHTLIDRLQSAQTPEELQFVLFDLKQVEFTETDPHFLLDDVILDPEIGLSKLEDLARLSIERLKTQTTKPQIFIYIEECDMAALDQKRFDNAVIKINKNAKKANIKLIYSTSRPAVSMISIRLLQSFDLLLTGQLASSDDAKYLGVPYIKKMDQYSFLVSQYN
jgi:DNA segregation ATPase FtsK/SpoIIIE-like protein